MRTRTFVAPAPTTHRAGTHEAGKTTVFLHLRALYGSPPDVQWDRDAVWAVRMHVLRGFQAVLQGVEAGGQAVAPEVAAQAAELVTLGREHRREEMLAWLEAHTAVLLALWGDGAVQRVVQHGAELGVQGVHNLEYFAQHLTRLGAPGFEPVLRDALHARMHTLGGTREAVLQPPGQAGVRLCDARGDRSERRRWIHVFAEARTVLYVSALTDYSEVLFEDETINRLDESLALVEEVGWARLLRGLPLVLLLTKYDVLPSRLKAVPLERKYPGYAGGADAGAAAEFIAARLEEASGRRRAGRAVLVRQEVGPLRDRCVVQAAQTAQRGADLRRLPAHLQDEVEMRRRPRPPEHAEHAVHPEQTDVVYTYIINPLDSTSMQRLVAELQRQGLLA
eukprot:TRINITY_DN3731_c0_g2_i7.p1 TRINITY_DN3731_c0_g2~~TRINITY_DN3731_c0_g2_i7.p1  ORF type:complete len:393 (-),score=86.37 TRINITY_DN3731_c0_g2_i7:29-1207(-)